MILQYDFEISHAWVILFKIGQIINHDPFKKGIFYKCSKEITVKAHTITNKVAQVNTIKIIIIKKKQLKKHTQKQYNCSIEHKNLKKKIK